jgi:plasmid replication initiation protein
MNKIKKYIVKSNNLIESRHKLSIQQSNIILWLLMQIKQDDEDFKPHQMDIKSFSELIDVRIDSQYSSIRSITKGLMRRVLEIYEPHKEEWLQVSWIASATYQKKKGCVILKFAPDLKPYLLQLKSCFTKIEIGDVLGLKSTFSRRIFELILQYESIGIRKISIDDLRKYCGIEEKQYKDYFDLKRFVILHTITEITAKTEYDISFCEIKESRRVAEIEFTIKKRTHFEKHQLEKALIISKELRSPNILVEQIMEYGFSRITAKKFLKQNSEEIVRNALKSVNLQIERKNVKNPKAMLRTAIQERWKPEVYLSKRADKS